MLGYENLNVNEKGNLTLNGLDLVEIAKEFKTPLYVMDIDLIRKNCKMFKDALNEFYKDRFLVCFASKAFCCKAIYKILQEEGFGADVVSLGEMFTALEAGFSLNKVYFHGNNKTEKELEFAVENNIKRIVVDNLEELLSLNEIAKKNNKKVEILLRIKPGVDAHVHEYVTTGKEDSKFGFAVKTNEALKAVKKALELKNIVLKGFHCHIGSQIFEIKPFLLATEKMLNFIKLIEEKTNFKADELNLGGGFGIKYVEEEVDLNIKECVKQIVETLEQKCSELNLKKPFLVFEPGRAIVAKAGLTLYSVGAVKKNYNEKIYVCVDGGMTDNPRYILYKSKYDCVICNKAKQEKTQKVSVAGKCCESGDLVAENVLLQKAEKNDILAVLATGAYNYSMMSNYNRNLNPAVLGIENKKCKILVKRQTLKDLLRNDV